MNEKTLNPTGAAVAALAIALTGSSTAAQAVSDADSLNYLVRGYHGRALQPSPWSNALRPKASGDFVGRSAGISVGEQFMRPIALYTCDMLDRGGWVNPYVLDQHDAVGNKLLAVRIGEGVTVRNPAWGTADPRIDAPPCSDS